MPVRGAAWSEDDVALLESMLSASAAFPAIASALERTTAAVTAKVRRRDGRESPQTKAATLNRAVLTDVVRREMSLTVPASAAAVGSVFDVILDGLCRGENVTIPNFGKFRLRGKGERLGRNPRSREQVVIPPRRVVIFEPSNKLRDRTAGK